MVLGVLIPIAILGLLVVAGAVLFNRGREGLDLAPRSLVRIYLYIASLAGIVVLVVGLSGVLNAGLAVAFGNGFVYGLSPSPVFARPCPPGVPPTAPDCAPAPQDAADRQQRELERRRGDDLIRGITFSVFGAVFWVAHWLARRGVARAGESQAGLHRGYLMIGTVVFGLATVILLPTGLYQALSYLILPPIEGGFRAGAGESLSGGIVTLPVWLIYLWLVVRDVRGQRAVPATTS